MIINIYHTGKEEYVLELQTGNMKRPARYVFRTREEAEQAEKVARLTMDRIEIIGA